MSTYKANFKSFVNQGLSIQYKQNQSETLIKCSKIIPSNYPQSQTGLYLDISIRDASTHQKSWASFENSLKQLFSQIIQIQKYPNSSLKILIFVLEQFQQIKSCIINGLWLLLLKSGINMKKSIYSWSKPSKKNNQLQIITQEQRIHQNNTTDHIIYNINSLSEPQPTIVEGQVHNQVSSLIKKRNNEEQTSKIKFQLQQYRNFVLQTMQNII